MSTRREDFLNIIAELERRERLRLVEAVKAVPLTTCRCGDLPILGIHEPWCATPAEEAYRARLLAAIEAESDVSGRGLVPSSGAGAPGSASTVAAALNSREATE